MKKDIIYTIGYEGLTVDRFVDQLKNAGIFPIIANTFRQRQYA